METIQVGFDHLIRENLIGEARKDALRYSFFQNQRANWNGPQSLSQTDHGSGRDTGAIASVRCRREQTAKPVGRERPCHLQDPSRHRLYRSIGECHPHLFRELHSRGIVAVVLTCDNQRKRLSAGQDESSSLASGCRRRRQPISARRDTRRKVRW